MQSQPRLPSNKHPLLYGSEHMNASSRLPPMPISSFSPSPSPSPSSSSSSPSPSLPIPVSPFLSSCPDDLTITKTLQAHISLINFLSQIIMQSQLAQIELKKEVVKHKEEADKTRSYFMELAKHVHEQEKQLHECKQRIQFLSLQVQPQPTSQLFSSASIERIFSEEAVMNDGAAASE